jgi:hypothetical protein
MTDRRIHGNPAFGLQFSEGYVDGPPIRREGEEAIQFQIHTLANAHTGMSLEQQKITEEIIAAVEFLLDELIVFRQQRARGAFIPAWDIGSRQEMSKGWDPLVPRQILQHALQKSDADGDGNFGQWWSMGA